MPSFSCMVLLAKSTSNIGAPEADSKKASSSCCLCGRLAGLLLMVPVAVSPIGLCPPMWGVPGLVFINVSNFSFLRS